MKRLLMLAGACLLIQAPLFAAGPKVGEPAPAFVGTDSNGQTHKLSDYKGKYVILEWHDWYCPWTKKYYDNGAMQKLQKEWTAKGVVWLTMISEGKGDIGYQTSAEANEYAKKLNAAPTATIMDPSGEIGHLYKAQSTLHMFVIGPDGKLLYNGAIDDHPGMDPAEIPISKNYVVAALNEAMSGKPVTVTTTHPYGCWIRYADGT
jgi:hypothetical protein